MCLGPKPCSVFFPRSKGGPGPTFTKPFLLLHAPHPEPAAPVEMDPRRVWAGKCQGLASSEPSSATGRSHVGSLRLNFLFYKIKSGQLGLWEGSETYMYTQHFCDSSAGAGRAWGSALWRPVIPLGSWRWGRSMWGRMRKGTESSSSFSIR